MTNPFEQDFVKYGGAFGVSPQVLTNIAQLESNFNPSAVNDWDSNAAAGTPSKGMMQFIEPTFDSFYGQASQARPELFSQLGKKNWLDPRQQIATTAWALSQGKGGHWATYDKASKGVVGPSQGVSQQSGTGVSDGLVRARIHANRGMANPSLMKRIAAAANTAGGMTGLSTGGDLAVYGEGGGGSYQPLFSHLQNKFGIKLDPGTGQTTAARASNPDSLHPLGRAFDIGSAKNAAQLPSIWEYLNKNKGKWGVSELLWEDRGTGNEHIHVGL